MGASRRPCTMWTLATAVASASLVSITAKPCDRPTDPRVDSERSPALSTPSAARRLRRRRAVRGLTFKEAARSGADTSLKARSSRARRVYMAQYGWLVSGLGVDDVLFGFRTSFGTSRELVARSTQALGRSTSGSRRYSEGPSQRGAPWSGDTSVDAASSCTATNRDLWTRTTSTSSA